MIIAHISDTHIDLGAPDADRRLADLNRTIAAINELTPRPDAIVHTGDITHNGRRDEYARATAILATARAPVYVLTGNKDNRANLRAAFAPSGYFTPDFDFVQYAIDRYPVRLIALDTQSSGNKGNFCSKRFEHLTRLIDADTSRPIAVFAHHPTFLVAEGPDPLHFEDRDVMLALRDVLCRSRRVAAIFSGHVHRAVAGDVAGIPAMVMTATATSLRHGQYPAGLRSIPVYQVHRFDPCWGFATETRIASLAAVRC